MDRLSGLRKRTAPTGESEGLLWRLVAAIIAVPIFEASLFLAMYLIFPPRTMAYLFMSIPMWIHAVYVGAAFTVGLLFGFNGVVWLLGHLFWTHHENERNRVMTVLLWGALAGLAFLASRFVQ